MTPPPHNSQAGLPDRPGKENAVQSEAGASPARDGATEQGESPENLGIPLKGLPAGSNGSAMQCEATQLMTQAKHGDRDAFDQLVSSVRGRAFHVARSFVGSREDALDLSQEALLKIYRARDSYRDGEPFLPWFHRILRNTCFSFLRKQGRLRKRSLNTVGDDQEESEWEIEDTDVPAPHDQLEGEERAQLFWKAFRTLRERDREILALRHFDELAYQEIAETLDIPIGTVMSRLFHARRRLRDGVGPLLEGVMDVSEN